MQLLCVQGVDIGRSDFLPGLPRVVSVSLLLRFLASHDRRSCCCCCCRSSSSSSLLIDVQLCVLFLRSLKMQGRRSEVEEGTSLAAVFEQTRSYCLFPSLRCKNVGQRCNKQARRSLLLTVEDCRRSNDRTSGILRQSCRERKNEGLDTRCRRREKGIQPQSEGTTDSKILIIL